MQLGRCKQQKLSFLIYHLANISSRLTTFYRMDSSARGLEWLCYALQHLRIVGICTTELYRSYIVKHSSSYKPFVTNILKKKRRSAKVGKPLLRIILVKLWMLSGIRVSATCNVMDPRLDLILDCHH